MYFFSCEIVLPLYRKYKLTNLKESIHANKYVVYPKKTTINTI